MTPLDWVIVAVAGIALAIGFRRGLVVGALTLAGFAAGAFAGARLAPTLLSEGSQSPWAPLVALIAALFLGALVASLAEVLGWRLRRRFGETLGVIDGIGGALLAAALALGLAWIVGAVALHTPGARELREPIQRSLILRELNAVLPPSGPLLRTLARFDPFPRIDGPGADVAPPDSAVARDPEVRRAGESVVRVLGTACGLGVQGTGWVVADGIVVTNAHVVAGQDDTTVDVGGDGGELDAEAVWFDVGNDLALLAVPDARGVAALELVADPGSGTAGAVLGFPENGPFDVRPARIGATRSAISQDAYGRGPVEREIVSFRALVRSGNSGGPVVDGDGRVLATVFASASESARPSGFGVPNAVVAAALQRASGPVDTGPCVR
ncbi:MAG: MarP family serine protease [Solirubrobacterales bacterium]|nr:MarP family serine protease [Solirubrobacterales bacterium]